MSDRLTILRSDCRQSSESFRPPFLKGGAVKGAEPLSRSAERETLLRRFLFAKLFLCAYMVKEKASFGIVLSWGITPFAYSLSGELSGGLTTLRFLHSVSHNTSLLPKVLEVSRVGFVVAPQGLYFGFPLKNRQTR